MIYSTCAYCEYFDGGGLNLVLKSREPDSEPLHGDCLNSLSPCYETTSKDTCPEFYQDTSVETLTKLNLQFKKEQL